MLFPKFPALVALMVVCGATVMAAQGGGIIRREEPPQPQREVERSSVRFAAPWRPAGASSLTAVIGTVIDVTMTPVARAKVQLRNLDTGEVEQESESSESGEYAFNVEGSGTYVVEMVMVDGFVVALSNAGQLSRFETMQTVVQLPGRWDTTRATVVVPQAPTAFLGVSAETTMTAQTIQIAVEQNVRPVNPGALVSPS